jgi:hypothetical protein
MISIPTKDDILWESTDAHKLREFLETPTGQKVLRHLSDLIPDLMDGEHINRTLVRSGEVKGAQSLLAGLVSLTIEQPAPLPIQSETYPPLDLEAAWDGDQPKTTTT